MTEAEKVESKQPPPGIDLIYYRIDTVPALTKHFKAKSTVSLMKDIQTVKSFLDFKLNVEEYISQDEFKEAKLYYDALDYESFFNVIENRVSQPVYDFLRALVWFHEGEYQHSMDILDKLIEEKHYHHNVFSLRANIYHKYDDLEQAEINVIYSIMNSFGHPETFENYGKLLLKLKDTRAARYAFKQSLLRRPDNPGLATLLGALMRYEIIYNLQNFNEKMQDKYKLNALGQIRVLNNATRNIWLNSYSMREGIKQALEPLGGQSLCIIGAGNCNNFDVNALSVQYEKVVLFDYDKYALGYARRIQRLKEKENVFFKFGTDVTGVEDEMYLWSQDMPGDEEIQRVIDQAGKIELATLNEYDVVVSDGMLQSFYAYCDAKLGSQHRLFNDLVGRIMLRHVQLMLDAVKPGGHAVIISEVLSSESNDGFMSVSSETTERLLRGELNETDKTLGFINPHFIFQLIQSNRHLFPQLEIAWVGKPWIWTYPGINYLVAPLIIKKQSPKKND